MHQSGRAAARVLAVPVTPEEISSQLTALNAGMAALQGYIPGLVQHFNALGVFMSELDQSVEQLRSAVNDLVGRLANQPDQTELLQQLADKQSELDAALANDATDQAQIDQLTGERDQLLTDAQENAAAVTQVTDQLKGLAGGNQPQVNPLSRESQIRS
jgi:chromosome segregation ATPase